MAKFKPNPRAKDPLACSFRPTGEDYVLCERWRNRDGEPVPSLRYFSSDLGPRLDYLTPRARREWKAAAAQEFAD